MRVLVTRPRPGADRTAQRLAGMGHEPVVLPLFQAQHRPDVARGALSGPVSAIIVTSAEVFRVLEPVRDAVSACFPVPVFAVGETTRTAAIAFGFTDVMAGTDGGADLARRIIALSRTRPDLGDQITYLAGDPRSPELEATLKSGGLACNTSVVYAMQPVAGADEALAAILAGQKPDVILFYSTETARHLFALVSATTGTDMLSETRLLCLSRNIAAVVPQSLQKHVEISRKPDENSLLDLLSQA